METAPQELLDRIRAHFSSFLKKACPVCHNQGWLNIEWKLFHDRAYAENAVSVQVFCSSCNSKAASPIYGYDGIVFDNQISYCLAEVVRDFSDQGRFFRNLRKLENKRCPVCGEIGIKTKCIRRAMYHCSLKLSCRHCSAWGQYGSTDKSEILRKALEHLAEYPKRVAERLRGELVEAEA